MCQLQDKRIFIIAEAGVNHNGSVETALKLVDAAADAGADAVKFQTFRAESVISTTAPKAAYQIAAAGPSESQLEMVKRLELSESDHLILLERCHSRGICFLSTPFDSESLRFLVNTIGVPVIKIPSGEITNAPFLLEIARTGAPVILSTGMSTLGEIEQALGVLAFGFLFQEGFPAKSELTSAYQSLEGRRMLARHVTLLHCTTEYPTPLNDVNLLAMDSLNAAFGLPVGYSDHTAGVAIPIAAAARGAIIIETHFTLARMLPGPDHQASIEPHELSFMVRSIREVETALGSHIKSPAPSELGNRDVVRKSIVVARNIARGEIFSLENVCVKRPGGGLSPFLFWELLGRSAKRDYRKDEVLGDEACGP